MMRKAFAAMACVFLNAPALAQVTDTPQASALPTKPILWATLALGDTPQEVADKLLQMPEVKSVRLKNKIASNGEGLAISYKGDGLAVLNENFSVYPLFANGRLSRVQLLEIGTCSNTASARYKQLRDIISAKYIGDSMADEPFTDMLFTRKMLGATPQMATQFTEVFTNESVAILAIVMFGRADPPQTAYGENAVTDLLSSISDSAYKAKAEACGGTGRYRANFSLQYIGIEEYRAMMAKVLQDAKATSNQASSKL